MWWWPRPSRVWKWQWQWQKRERRGGGRRRRTAARGVGCCPRWERLACSAARLLQRGVAPDWARGIGWSGVSPGSAVALSPALLHDRRPRSGLWFHTRPVACRPARLPAVAPLRRRLSASGGCCSPSQARAGQLLLESRCCCALSCPPSGLVPLPLAAAAGCCRAPLAVPGSSRPAPGPLPAPGRWLCR